MIVRANVPSILTSYCSDMREFTHFSEMFASTDYIKVKLFKLDHVPLWLSLLSSLTSETKYSV